MKARRGDLSGPVLAILVTLVLLAIGAAIVAYFVLLGGAPQQGVIAVVGQPTIVKTRANGFTADITIKNVGSTTMSFSSTSDVKLKIIGEELSADSVPSTGLAPGGTATITFSSDTGWSTIQSMETVSGALIIKDVGTLEVVFRVIKSS